MSSTSTASIRTSPIEEVAGLVKENCEENAQAVEQLRALAAEKDTTVPHGALGDRY